jgi:AsmA-like C-terminal region
MASSSGTAGPERADFVQKTSSGRAYWLRWTFLMAAIAVLTGVGVALHAYWPYSEVAVVPPLQQAFHAGVSIQTFRRIYFPHPGCEAQQLTLTRGSGSESRQVATVQKMKIIGRYVDLIFQPHHLAHIQLDGLYVRIPSRDGKAVEPPRSHDHPVLTASNISVGSITADNAVLEFANAQGNDPLKFEIHKLRLTSVAAGSPMNYQLSMRIPEPPGEVESEGFFGPWQNGKIGKIALQGTANLRDAKLDKYSGISGTLQSEEKFSGTLDQINVDGQAHLPDFRVKSANHPVEISSRFQATVNGLRGEAQLKTVTANVRATTLQVRGAVARNPESGNRDTTVDFNTARGRVEDVLWLFSSARKPAMTGDAKLSGHAQVRQFGPVFLRNVKLNGQFDIRAGHFRQSTQAKLNELSARAAGKKIQKGQSAPDVAVQQLSSEFVVSNGIAHLGHVFFQVPGVRARADGTYGLTSYQVNLSGDLWTDAEVSKDTTGIWSALLTPLDPIFRRKHAGAMVSVVMSGDIDDPHFGMVPATKKKIFKAGR